MVLKETQFKGYYVSNEYPEIGINRQGRVIRLKDCVDPNNSIKGEPFSSVGDKSFGVKNSIGYMYVRTYCKSLDQRMKVFLHRVSAFAFIGKPPKGKEMVNHNDTNRSNNKLSNLSWVSNSDNIKHINNINRPNTEKYLDWLPKETGRHV